MRCSRLEHDSYNPHRPYEPLRGPRYRRDRPRDMTSVGKAKSCITRRCTTTPMDGKKVEVELDIHASSGPGASYLGVACDKDFYGKFYEEGGRVHLPIFIGNVEFPDYNYEQIGIKISCLHDFFTLEIPE